MRYRLRPLMIVLALGPPFGCTGCGFLWDKLHNVDALYYAGFYFRESYGGRFKACVVDEKQQGLEKIFVSFRGSPRKRLADLTWEDFLRWYELDKDCFVFQGTAERGAVNDGRSYFSFEKGQLSQVEIKGSNLEYSGSESGPCIEFTAIMDQLPTRKQIEAAFGTPVRVGRIPDSK